MGNTYEVWGWREFAPDQYDWDFIYGGGSEEDALNALWEADKEVYGCVKLEWR